jgi:hypothetical protein
MIGSCEHDNDTLGCIKYEESLDYLSDYFLEEYSTPLD